MICDTRFDMSLTLDFGTVRPLGRQSLVANWTLVLFSQLRPRSGSRHIHVQVRERTEAG